MPNNFVHVSGRMEGVDASLISILDVAAREWVLRNAPGGRVEVISGKDARSAGTSHHPSGRAIDVRLYDASGRELFNRPLTNPSRKDAIARDFRAYEQFAQMARAIQQRDFPQLGDKFRWGGYFGGRYPFDLMHFDVSGGPTSKGSWKTGLNAEGRRLLSGVVSHGLTGDVAQIAGGGLGRSTIESLQRGLNSAGFRGENGRPLKVDGALGTQTRHAISQLQATLGVDPTGAYDSATREAVRVMQAGLNQAKPSVGREPFRPLATDGLFGPRTASVSRQSGSLQRGADWVGGLVDAVRQRGQTYQAPNVGRGLAGSPEMAGQRLGDPASYSGSRTPQARPPVPFTGNLPQARPEPPMAMRELAGTVPPIGLRPDMAPNIPRARPGLEGSAVAGGGLGGSAGPASFPMSAGPLRGTATGGDPLSGGSVSAPRGFGLGAEIRQRIDDDARRMVEQQTIRSAPQLSMEWAGPPPGRGPVGYPRAPEGYQAPTPQPYTPSRPTAGPLDRSQFDNRFAAASTLSPSSGFVGSPEMAANKPEGRAPVQDNLGAALEKLFNQVSPLPTSAFSKEALRSPEMQYAPAGQQSPANQAINGQLLGPFSTQVAGMGPTLPPGARTDWQYDTPDPSAITRRSVPTMDVREPNPRGGQLAPPIQPGSFANVNPISVRSMLPPTAPAPPEVKPPEVKAQSAASIFADMLLDKVNAGGRQVVEALSNPLVQLYANPGPVRSAMAARPGNQWNAFNASPGALFGPNVAMMSLQMAQQQEQQRRAAEAAMGGASLVGGGSLSPVAASALSRNWGPVGSMSPASPNYTPRN
jgi:hypothetical protein